MSEEEYQHPYQRRLNAGNIPVSQIPQIITQHILRPRDLPARGTVARVVIRAVAPPYDGARDEREDVAAHVNSVPLYVSRCPLRAIDLPRDDAASVAEREDEARRSGAFVRARDVGREPGPHDRNRDEPG